jgi:hypothetical protein
VDFLIIGRSSLPPDTTTFTVTIKGRAAERFTIWLEAAASSAKGRHRLKELKGIAVSGIISLGDLSADAIVRITAIGVADGSSQTVTPRNT